MLEQTAGISIYKTRKKEAKLKLDATEQDLGKDRPVSKSTTSWKPLESQAKKAEEIPRIKKEYREVEYWTGKGFTGRL